MLAIAGRVVAPRMTALAGRGGGPVRVLRRGREVGSLRKACVCPLSSGRWLALSNGGSNPLGSSVRLEIRKSRPGCSAHVFACAEIARVRYVLGLLHYGIRLRF